MTEQRHTSIEFAEKDTPRPYVVLANGASAEEDLPATVLHVDDENTKEALLHAIRRESSTEDIIYAEDPTVVITADMLRVAREESSERAARKGRLATVFGNLFNRSGEPVSVLALHGSNAYLERAVEQSDEDRLSIGNMVTRAQAILSSSFIGGELQARSQMATVHIHEPSVLAADYPHTPETANALYENDNFYHEDDHKLAA